MFRHDLRPDNAIPVLKPEVPLARDENAAWEWLMDNSRMRMREEMT